MLECNAIKALKRIIDSDMYGIEYDDCDDKKTVEEFTKYFMCTDYIPCINDISCPDETINCDILVQQIGITFSQSCSITLVQLNTSTFH